MNQFFRWLSRELRELLWGTIFNLIFYVLAGAILIYVCLVVKVSDVGRFFLIFAALLCCAGLYKGLSKLLRV